MSLDDARLFTLPPAAEPYEGDLPAQGADFQARASAEGADYDEIAFEFLELAGGTVERVHHFASIPVDAIVTGANGRRFLVAAHGTIDDHAQSGLRRVETVHKAGHRAFLLPEDAPPLIVLTSHLPRGGTQPAVYLARSAARIFDVIATKGDLRGFTRLKTYLTQDPALDEPLDAAWRVLAQQGDLLEDGGRDDA
ncbi:MAG: hypothetical protein QOH90_838 [Actinomycetota bacterium]|nr:hypothetical protein [Actinomycetota bacterium]